MGGIISLAAWTRNHFATLSFRFALEDLAVFHDEAHALEFFDIRQWITIHGDDIRKRSGTNFSQLPLLLEQLGGARGGAADGIHGGHAEFDHVGKFLRDGFGPGDAADVGAEGDFQVGLERLLEGLFMYRGAFAVALAIGGIFWRPIAVIHGQCRHIPRALLGHLSDRYVVQVEPVLNGVASTFDSAVQADAAIGVASDAFAPAVDFIGNRLQLLQGEGGLGDQLSMLSDPGTVGHVDFDPVGAVLELLARGLTRLDRAIDQLSSFWDVDFWRIALERVTTGRGDGAGDDEQARAGDDALVHGLLDTNVAIACAFGFQIAQGGEALIERALD